MNDSNSKKKIILAKPRGFCAGVRRAVGIVEKALLKYKRQPLYVFHKIVHNEHVVGNFQKRGVVFIESLFDLNASHEQTYVSQESNNQPVLILSAHGVPAKIETEALEMGVKVIDATCPLVKKIHKKAIRLEKDNYKLILIGHAGHPEITGTAGQLNIPPFIIASPDEVDNIKFCSKEKIAYLSQTTLSPDDISEIVVKLTEKYPDIKGGDDICYATKNRQNAVKMLAKQCDTIFIIGSPESSNSRRLVEAARKQNPRTFLIKDENDITDSMLCPACVIGISAAASAPEELVSDVVDTLKTAGWPEPLEQDGEDECIKFPEPDF